MLLFCSEVFDQVLQASGGASSVTAYSAEETWRMLGALDKAYVQFRATQITVGSGNPSITIALETSNDGVFWKNKSTPFLQMNVVVGTPKDEGGFDTGSNPGGCFTRIAVTLNATTNPSANVKVTVAGRGD